MKRVNLILSDGESRNLEILVSKYGGKKTSLLRTLLKQAYEKEFGGYKGKHTIKGVQISDEQLTNEQLCERVGKVVERNGMMMCEILQGAMTRYVPLDKPELF